MLLQTSEIAFDHQRSFFPINCTRISLKNQQDDLIKVYYFKWLTYYTDTVINDYYFPAKTFLSWYGLLNSILQKKISSFVTLQRRRIYWRHSQFKGFKFLVFFGAIRLTAIVDPDSPDSNLKKKCSNAMSAEKTKANMVDKIIQQFCSVLILKRKKIKYIYYFSTGSACNLFWFIS